MQTTQLNLVIMSNLSSGFVGGGFFGSTTPLPASSSHLQRCPPLTAIALVRLVVTVCVAIAAPACVDAQATVTHELPRTAGLVGGWETHQTSLCTVSRSRPESHSPSILAPPVSAQEEPGNPESPPHPPCDPAPAGTCALPTQPGLLPPSTQLARALTAVRLVRPVSAVIIAITVVNVEDAAAVGTLELFQVAGGGWHCRGWKESRGGEGHTLRSGQRRGQDVQAEYLPQVRCNQASLKMALVDSHSQVDQNEAIPSTQAQSRRSCFLRTHSPCPLLMHSSAWPSAHGTEPSAQPSPTA